MPTTRTYLLNQHLNQNGQWQTDSDPWTPELLQDCTDQCYDHQGRPCRVIRVTVVTTEEVVVDNPTGTPIPSSTQFGKGGWQTKISGYDENGIRVQNPDY